jgi:hypothetical protein
MISKKHFLAQMKKLNTIYPDSAINDAQALIYYETMANDFTDEQFTKQLNFVLKNSFKFPPIAAFYKVDPDAPVPIPVYDPVTPEESIRLRRVLDL